MLTEKDQDLIDKWVWKKSVVGVFPLSESAKIHCEILKKTATGYRCEVVCQIEIYNETMIVDLSEEAVTYIRSFIPC